jgi:hypothetical protein
LKTVPKTLPNLQVQISLTLSIFPNEICTLAIAIKLC